MKKATLLISILIASCKDPDWGYKARDFAYNEAPGIISELSKKDLHFKWYNYFFTQSSFALSEINRANFIMNSLSDIQLDRIDTDQVELMSSAYKIDQQINTLYEVNTAINYAESSLIKSLSACEGQELLNFYMDKRSYLSNSFQMAMPQLNFTYSASFTFATDDATNSSKKGNGQNGIDTIPLIGNITTFFSEKKAKENKRKYQEAQDYMNNIKLNQAEMEEASRKYCLENRHKFFETFEILKGNINTEKENFRRLYTALSNLRNALAPLVIKNIIARFSSVDQMVYSVQKDSHFTKRMLEINQVANQLTVNGPPTTAKEIEAIESKIDIAEDLIAELEMSKNTVLGIKNQRLISSLDSLLKKRRNLLLNAIKERLP